MINLECGVDITRCFRIGTREHPAFEWNCAACVHSRRVADTDVVESANNDHQSAELQFEKFWQSLEILKPGSGVHDQVKKLTARRNDEKSGYINLGIYRKPRCFTPPSPPP